MKNSHLFKNFNLCVLIFFAFIISSCNNGEGKNKTEKENLAIYVKQDTSNYKTEVIETKNIESGDMFLVWYDCTIANNSDKSVSIVSYDLLEKPNNGASYTIAYANNPNGLYEKGNNKKIDLPINLEAGKGIHYTLKHGFKIEKSTLKLIKENFKNLNILPSKDVFALLEKKEITIGKENNELLNFELSLKTSSDTIFRKDVNINTNDEKIPH